MVIPGSLDIAIIRGIAFDGLILQCKDENAVVSSGIIPGIAGLYTRYSPAAGKAVYVLLGHGGGGGGQPTWFLYFHVTLGWILSQTLTADTVTDYLSLSVAPVPEDNIVGTYVGFGVYTEQAADVTDNPTDLTGFTPAALVRRTADPNSEVLLDLQPYITLPYTITIPPITRENTESIRSTGIFRWDLPLIDNFNERSGPYVAGNFVVSDYITQPQNA